MQWFSDQSTMQQLLHANFPIRHSQVEEKIDSAENPELGVPETADAAKEADPAEVPPSTTVANVWTRISR